MRYIISSSRLKQALNSKNMTARELSIKSGVSEASISQYINGTHKPGNISSGKMAKVLECDPVWLMGFNTANNNSYDPDFEVTTEPIGAVRVEVKPKTTSFRIVRSTNVYEFGHFVTDRMSENKDFYELVNTAYGISDKDLSTAISILKVFIEKGNNP